MRKIEEFQRKHLEKLFEEVRKTKDDLLELSDRLAHCMILIARIQADGLRLPQEPPKGDTINPETDIKPLYSGKSNNWPREESITVLRTSDYAIIMDILRAYRFSIAEDAAEGK